MRTVAETPIFIRYASEIWSEVEETEHITLLADNTEAGAVIRGSGGCRKVRWSRAGIGERGGARIAYFVAMEESYGY